LARETVAADQGNVVSAAREFAGVVAELLPISARRDLSLPA
jgi:hypothetical protein